LVIVVVITTVYLGRWWSHSLMKLMNGERDEDTIMLFFVSSLYWFFWMGWILYLDWIYMGI